MPRQDACPCEDLLDQYLLKWLSPKQASVVASHLGACESCTNRITETQLMIYGFRAALRKAPQSVKSLRVPRPQTRTKT